MQLIKSSHDFGNDILPRMFPDGKVFIYDLIQNHIPGAEEEEKGTGRMSAHSIHFGKPIWIW